MFCMSFFEKLKAKFAGAAKPEHLRRGELGERAAKKHLQQAGLKFLAANFRSAHGEIDLIFAMMTALSSPRLKPVRPRIGRDRRRRWTHASGACCRRRRWIICNC